MKSEVSQTIKIGEFSFQHINSLLREILIKVDKKRFTTNDSNISCPKVFPLTKNSKLRNKRVLVTGGAGFIGSEIVRQLHSLGAKIIVFDNYSSGKRRYIGKIPVVHGTSVILSTMKFVSIEHPLKFYGVIGLGFLSIGLFFIIWTLQIFSESRQILTNITLIGFGSSLFGMMLIMTAIILYSLVSVVREQTDNQSIFVKK